MKINDTESIEERAYRNSVVLKEGRNRLPLVIVLAIAALIIAVFIGYTKQNRLSNIYGVGNPYNCESCKNLGRACSKHRDYDREKDLYNKVYKFVDRVDPDNLDDTQSKYIMYGYGNEYNTECDFCKKNKEECYSCKYDRLYIEDAYSRITNTSYFYSLLCDDCYIYKQAKDTMCKEMLTRLIIDDIHSEVE